MAKPIFCATHPRACSTAFERVFMTRPDLACVHEPFGDAFYYGPERLSTRFEGEEVVRTESGFQDSSYKTIFEHIEQKGAEGQRVFIKDILHYLLPPDARPAQIAPSLEIKKRGIGTTNGYQNGVNGVNGNKSPTPFPYHTECEPGNPTVVPRELLGRFHFTFLIRDPHSSIPSYYRCTVPPLVEMTGFHDFYPSEAGYNELRRFFDYLRESGQVGPHVAAAAGPDPSNGHQTAVNGDKMGAEICVVDADDLLDDPEGIIQAYCKSVGLDYTPEMLVWDSPELQARAKNAFEKWRGFHEDAINSKDLKPRAHKKVARTEEEWDQGWKSQYGEKAAKLIRQTVDDNMADYLHLKQFAIKGH